MARIGRLVLQPAPPTCRWHTCCVKTVSQKTSADANILQALDGDVDRQTEADFAGGFRVSVLLGFIRKKKSFRSSARRWGVRNPDRSGSGSGLVAAAFLDLAHEVDQDQVFPRPWSAEPAGEPKLPGGDPGP